MATTRLLVCRTCPRYERAPPPGAPTRGTALGRTLRADPRFAGVEVRAVVCLAGCRNPCNATLDAPGKARLRFSRLEAPDAAALLEAFSAHDRSADGELAEAELPESLRDRLTARSPARLGG